MEEINWSEKFNSLSPEIRKIGAAAEAQLRIQHLNFEKNRLKKHYKQSVSEIDEHIKNCQSWLKKMSEEI